MNHILSMILNIIYLLLFNIILCDFLTDLKFFIGKSEFNYVDILCLLVFFIMRINDLNIFIKNFIVMFVLIVIPIFLLMFYLVQGIIVMYSEYENIITIWEFTFAREPSKEELDCFIKEKLEECKLSEKYKVSNAEVKTLITNSSNEHGIVSLKVLSKNIEKFVTYVNNNIEKREADKYYSKIYNNVDKAVVNSITYIFLLAFATCTLYLIISASLVGAHIIDDTFYVILRQILFGF